MSLGMTVITNDDLQTIIAKWYEGEPLETIDDDCLIYTNFSGKVHRFTDIVVANALDTTNPVLKQFIADTDGYYDDYYELNVATLLNAMSICLKIKTLIQCSAYLQIKQD